MKILLLNQAFYPDVAATAQVLGDLAAALVRRGHAVTVVCSSRAYDAPTQRYPARETWQGVKIRRISSLGLGKKARWRRAADFASYLANCVLHLAALPKFDLVIGMTSPPLISYFGALFTRFKGGRFVFWVMDLNPDEALVAGWLKPDAPVTRLLQGMLQYGLDRADTIVALDRFMAQRIEAKRIHRKKIAVIPPWSHDHMVQYDSEGRDRFRAEHGFDDKFVVMYSGNHSPCHPLTTLLEAARVLRDEPHIAFCFVGGGSEFKKVQQFGKEHGLANLTTLPYQPLNRLSASLSAADLHVVVMGDPFVGVVHPCKVYNIRTLGIPFLYIGPRPSHLTELHPAYSAGHGDVASVVGHLRAAAASRIKPERSPAVGNRFGQEKLIAELVTLLEAAPQERVVPESEEISV